MPVAMFNGQPIFGPRGPIGPDGNPIGSVISYMGLTAPQDYLICDGTEYNIADYPKLAEHFTKQFGEANHFGGDGETTFAVPDMRNLFLRGYHGESEEQLSEDIGEKQDATRHLLFENNGGSNYAVILPKNSINDTYNPSMVDSYLENTNFAGWTTERTVLAPRGMSAYYTSRPVNMAVLYCIKAVTSVSAENVYSTEEQVVGRWINGKSIYRKVVNGSLSAKDQWEIIETVSDLDFVCTLRGIVYKNDDVVYDSIPNYEAFVAISSNKKNIVVRTGLQNYVNKQMTIIIEYTKTTD